MAMHPVAARPWYLRVLPDLLAFGIGLAVAYCLNWQTTDLVWSLWLCSLVLGYLTILSTIGAGAYIGLQALRHNHVSKGQRLPAILVGGAFGLFFLCFFSVHFCGFHAGHSVFLRQFFPLAGMPRDGFGDAFMNPPLLWVLVFRHLMAPYGIFLVPALIAERRHVFLPVIKAVQALREESPRRSRDRKKGEATGAVGNHNPGEMMVRPYINVVRMHILIFFFAFCHFLKVDSFLVYAVVYTVYFFPWRELKNLRVTAAAKSRPGRKPA